ncbi:complement factor H-related protein 5 [Podarcis raffonei]|uniref:complement factor H-related protein 5 n=1 Tax=Podarcis raffonei TaxID=65483 RepID=UPI0023294A67|nr:complement factor H-related protein 5 [Podarcis raffonei]
MKISAAETCQVPTQNNEIFNTSQSVFLFEEILHFKCKDGFETIKKATSDHVVCTENGWSPNPECLPIHCDGFLLENGLLDPRKNQYQHGDVVTFSCRGNYKRVGPDSAQCYHFGWSPQPPTCKEHVDPCQPPPSIADGSISGDLQEEYEHGEKVEYKCNFGFTMTGSKLIECLDGQWTSLPLCKEEPRTCEVPPNIRNGRPASVDSDRYLHGETVAYECNERFYIVGTKEAVCLHGQWELPSCVDVAAKCTRPQNAEFVPYASLEKKFMHNNVVTYTCGSNQHKTKCVNGKWSPEPECIGTVLHAIYKCMVSQLEGTGYICPSASLSESTIPGAFCPPPPQLPNAIDITDTRNYKSGEEISFRCQENFFLQGPQKIKCDNGKWQTPPRCLVSRCGDPPAIAHGEVNNRSQRKYLSGESVEYHCHEGFELGESSTSTCENREWSPPPTCREKSCGEPPILIDAAYEGVIKNRYKSGDLIPFNCAPGYATEGPRNITCHKGKWSEASTCEDAICGEPPAVASADIVAGTAEIYLPDDEVHYQCHEGFEISGSPNITCQNKEWSQPPTCVDVTCPPPPRVSNGQITTALKQRYLPLEKVRYRCRQGYSLLGAFTVKCVNKEWTESPRCIDAAGKCGPPPPIENGEFLGLANSEYMPGAYVQYKCQTFYKPRGIQYVRCVNGHWTDIPTCTVPCTATKEDMNQNNIQLRWKSANKIYSASGDKTEFACKRGFRPDPSSPPFRAPCREGKLDYPRCIPVAPCGITKQQLDAKDLLLPGKRRRSQVIQHNQFLQFLCKEGHVITAPSVRKCIDGHMDLPSCISEITCQKENIDHGYILNPKKLYKEGDRLRFSCSNGYKHAERSDATCTRNGWSSRLACIEIVCSPPQVENGDFHPKQSYYEYQDTIETQCEPGYQLQNRQSPSMCTETGWSPPPICIPKNCDYIRIENGQLSDTYERWKDYYFPKRVGQTVDYSCSYGFLPRNKETWGRSLCTNFGWNPEPKCFKICDIPRLLAHVTFNTHTWQKFIEGDEISYSCEAGYHPTNQQAKAVCTKNGWSPTPRCNVKKICQLAEPPNGFFTERKNRYNLNDKISYRCQPGFTTPQGLETGDIQCHEGGWKPEPKCIQTCQVPTQNNVIFNTSQSVFLFEEILHYKCKDGFETIKKATADHVVCTENGWSPNPECLPIHCDGFLLENGLLDPRKNQYQHGDVVKFSCRGNNKRVGPDSAQCYHFGWSPQPPTCKAQVDPCQPPPSISDGSISGDLREEYEHGEKVEYKCNFGFAMTGSKLTECLDGQWTSLPLCKEETRACEVPPNIRNGRPVSVDSDRYLHGKTVAYECNGGFFIVGTIEAVCLHGQWELPSCVDVAAKCTRPQNAEFVPFASLEKSFMHNNVATYICGSNQHKTKCVNGKWSPEPECTAFCPPPPQLPNAIDITDTRNYKSGEEISFRCQENFFLQGPQKIKCDNGKWQTPPRCLDTTCGDPPAVAHGEVNNSSQRKYLSGESVEYHCHEGFELGESSTSTCENREWSPPPTCREKSCGEPPRLTDAAYEGLIKNRYEPGDLIPFSCAPGYATEGSRNITCHKGKWSEASTCEVPCIGTEEDMNQNNIQLKWRYSAKLYTVSGDVTEFDCKWGFGPDPSSPPFRALCREGKLDYPRCIPIR